MMKDLSTYMMKGPKERRRSKGELKRVYDKRNTVRSGSDRGNSYVSDKTQKTTIEFRVYETVTEGIEELPCSDRSKNIVKSFSV